MIILVGASASGKTEVATYLRAKYGIKRAITHTSRSPRTGEEDGVDYYFVSDEEFLKLKQEGAFVETTYYNRHYYGCSKAEISEDKAVVVDPNGLESFLKLGDSRIVTFYLKAKEDTRRKRMILRGDGEEMIQQRLLNDVKSFNEPYLSQITDYQLTTDDRPISEVGDEVYRLYKQGK